MADKTIKLTLQQALLKMAHYCAYQERCHYEAKNKLAELGIYYDKADQIIAELITQNYLNEERFAKAYAGGKFRIKKWGRNKIKQELKQKQLSEYCIQQGLKEIDADDYLVTLKKEAIEKYKKVKDKNVLVKNNKTAQYLMSRGFEGDLVWDVLKELK
ncbi:MAG: regulatory protein RecX [Bacteroidia bacterium]